VKASSLWDGIRAHALQKLLWHTGVGAWIALCYYPPQCTPWRSAILLEPAFGESLVPFMPEWALVYQSVFLLHTAAFWANNDLRRVRRYGFSIALSFAVGALCFWVWPTQVKRPSSDNFIYQWLIVKVDGPSNAFPSLHAAMATLGVIRFWPNANALGRCFLTAWWSLLLFSTLATLQHRIIDLVFGTLLALIISWIVHRKCFTL
jgi:PAP2 superfamily